MDNGDIMARPLALAFLAYLLYLLFCRNWFLIGPRSKGTSEGRIDHRRTSEQPPLGGAHGGALFLI